MSGHCSKELLALHVEGDLPEEEAIRVSQHLAGCEECHQFFEELHASQSGIKALRRETCRPEACVEMRRDVMSTIRDSERSTAWPVRVERALLSGLRRRGFAFASLASLAAMVSGLLLIPLRHVAVNPSMVAVYEADRLVFPDGYQEWTLLTEGAASTVYITPSAYREFTRSGVFPEGTVIVRESGASSVQVSVKDENQFEGGWGFFDFSAGARPAALAADAACRSCHERNGGYDHVFTQSYPALKLVRGQSS